VFTLAEKVAAFDIGRVNPNPARFDLKKCTAINADHLRWMPQEELARRLLPYLQSAGLSVDKARLAPVVPLIAERIATLAEAVPMVWFLFCRPEQFAVDPADAKLLAGSGQQVLVEAHQALAGLTDWTTTGIESTLRAALIDGLQLKPRSAFGPIRVAVTGRRVSPPLFESLELLGAEVALGRLAAAIEE
jgi:glutamyl-tRNA synthetase